MNAALYLKQELRLRALELAAALHANDDPSTALHIDEVLATAQVLREFGVDLPIGGTVQVDAAQKKVRSDLVDQVKRGTVLLTYPGVSSEAVKFLDLDDDGR